jgi:hypothetical protein
LFLTQRGNQRLDGAAVYLPGIRKDLCLEGRVERMGEGQFSDGAEMNSLVP